ncbi:MAG: HAD-IIIC family phosphatase [Rickettsiales bacterium]|nr:MAG: HAD-IIIC family phosphatase [Rickettsiales bacterium]
MRVLQYPFDADYIIKKRKAIVRELLEQPIKFLDKKIAILGGSTTSAIKDNLEVFLLNNGIKPVFYECEYAQYWQDAMFGEELLHFKPDVIFIHTSFRNITDLPTLQDSQDLVNSKLQKNISHFKTMWEKLISTYHCPIIQNNFERPIWRLMGNRDVWDFRGASNFVSRLNQEFYTFAQEHKDFFINDIDYLSAKYGLEKWHDAYYWHMFKYACCVPAIPELAFSVANIVKSIYGKNKKGLVLDLDNTLWGGIVGDDGVDNLALGQEVSMGQAYTEFQSYIKQHKDLGIILNISSKNEEENAIAGLNHPDGVLRPDDFAVIKANWEPKSSNIGKIATTLNIGLDSLVFVDDNPVEREIVRTQVPEVVVPEVNSVEEYIRTLDGAAFFETTAFTEEDLKKSEMYAENAKRAELEQTFTNYTDFLFSLEMNAVIKDFEPIYMQRISQLTNKSNQFNLTTKRYSESDMQNVASSKEHIRLYGKLTDKFGDNGVVSVVIGRKNGNVLDMELWLMSCRVLKREMEFAMLDRLVEEASKQNIKTIKGYYYPTPKNAMVKEFYATQGFIKTNEDGVGNTEWELDVASYKKKCEVIKINSTF